MIAGICGAVALGSCANMNSITKRRDLHGSGEIHFVDAKQRAVLAQKWREYQRNSGGEIETTWLGTPKVATSYYRFCSEPPPDTYSVLGYSLAAQLQGSWPGLATETDKKLNAQIAQSLSESGSTIERTQTINLLRESMFRTCERYMNGALDDEEFVIQAARDQRAMVAILAIEQLTGVVRPAPTVLVSSGGAVVTSNPEAIADQLSKALDGKVAAKQAHDEAAEKLEAMESKACKPDDDNAVEVAEELVAPPETTPPEDEEQAAEPAGESPQQETECTEADAVEAQKDVVEKAAEALEEASKHYDTIKSMADSIGSAAAWSRANGKPGEAGGAVSMQDRTAVASAVERIVEKTFSDESELTFLCIRAFRGDGRYPEQIVSKCAQLYQATLERRVEFLDTYGSSPLEQSQKSSALFEIFWVNVAGAKVEVDDDVRSNIRASVTSPAVSGLNSSLRKLLEEAQSRAYLEKIFKNGLGPRQQAELVQVSGEAAR